MDEGVGLIGREREHAELRTLVTRSRVVLVYGAAGVGKTQPREKQPPRQSIPNPDPPSKPKDPPTAVPTPLGMMAVPMDRPMKAKDPPTAAPMPAATTAVPTDPLERER